MSEVPSAAVDMVDILVTSTINSFGTQRRFPKSITIGDLKKKLELLTGASSASMELQLIDKDKQIITKIVDDTSFLGSYPIKDGMCINVIDSAVRAGEYEDVSKVKKFELSEEEYEKRGESLRAFKLQHKLGKYNEEELAKQEAEKEKKQQEEKEIAETIKVGDRCEVRVTGQPSRRGCVMFVGETEFKPGYWVGVKYDEPTGKNDGSVGGKRYFECLPKYGGFVKPHDVVIGDFPEIGIENDEI